MPKHDARAPALIEDFKPFYLKDGLIWAPYYAANKWRLHCMAPELAWKGIHNAVRVLGHSGKVVPITAQALRGREH